MQSIPVDFNTDILKTFQDFLNNISAYNDYMDKLGNPIPESIVNAAKDIKDFRDGLKYSFIQYIQDIGSSIHTYYGFDSLFSEQSSSFANAM